MVECPDIVKCAIDQSLKDMGLEVVLRPKQEEAIRSIVKGKDTLVLLPTASGKTLIFQILPFLLANINSVDETVFTDNPIVVVISPLVALIEDQLNSCKNLGIEALKVDSQSIKSKNLKCQILFSSPEFWTGDGGRDFLLFYKKDIACIVVDECHRVIW